MNDETLLATVPDFLSIGGLLKASPVQEAGKRYIFLEASNEDVDHQNEVVMQKALSDSADYFLRHGNIDLSHFTLLGPKQNIPNYLEYEIGRPVAVRMDGKRTFVKAELYSGDSPMARNATMVWDSITKQDPPMRWYPSVGGSVLSKSVKVDPKSGDKVAVIEKVRWNNIALDRCPVNKSVPEASLAPVGTFAKALGGFVLGKALEASHSTDSAGLTGGGALRMQSIDTGSSQPRNYFDFRNKLAARMRDGTIKSPTAQSLVEFSHTNFGLSFDEAAEWIERFMRDLKTNLQRRKSK